MHSRDRRRCSTRVIAVAPSENGIAIASKCRHSHLPIVVTICVAQPFIGSDFRGATTPPLLPRPKMLSVVWGLSVSGAGNMQRCSWLRPHLGSPCPDLDGRTADLAASTSTEFWRGLSGRAFWLCSLRLVFRFAIFRFWGVNRGLFFLYKVRSPTQCSLKPSPTISATIFRKMVQASFLDATLKILCKYLFGLKQLPT